MATPDASPMSPANKALLGKVFAHPANDTITRLVRVLSTATGIDSTLLLVGYSLAAVSDQLNNLVNTNLRQLAERLAEKASTTLLPGETVIASLPAEGSLARVARARDATKILSSMCSDVRAVLRLWGLLKIWLLARGTYFNPPKDSLLKYIAWSQILSISGYYVLEHGFYLASKGVYKWDPKDIASTFKTSIKLYGFYLFMDYVRLWRMAKLAQQTPASEKPDASKQKEAAAQWYKTLQVNAGYTPLVFHWATDGGLFSETTVGLLGAVAGVASFREAWKQAA